MAIIVKPIGVEKCFIDGKVLNHKLNLRTSHKDSDVCVIPYNERFMPKIMCMFGMRDRCFAIVTKPDTGGGVRARTRNMLCEIDTNKKQLVELDQKFYKNQNFITDDYGFANYVNVAKYNDRYFTVIETQSSYGSIFEFDFNTNQFNEIYKLEYQFRGNIIDVNDKLYILTRESNRHTLLQTFNPINNSITLVKNYLKYEISTLYRLNSELLLIDGYSHYLYKYNESDDSVTQISQLNIYGPTTDIYMEYKNKLYGDEFIINEDYSFTNTRYNPPEIFKEYNIGKIDSFNTFNNETVVIAYKYDDKTSKKIIEIDQLNYEIIN